jgi:membrane fusion protein, multidrug efflux system
MKGAKHFPNGGTMFAALALALAMAMVMAGCSDSSSRSEAASPTTPPAVAARPASAPPATTPSANGALSVLTVEHQVDVTAQRDGVVTGISKDEGAAVNAGEVLGKLDDRSLQTELVKARDDLQVDENNHKYKEAELKAKTSALHRQEQLRANGLSTDADLETAQFEAKAAEYDMKGYEALVESGHAEINRLNLEVEQTQIKAPFSGVVVRRYIREGQAVTKGDKTFRVTQLAPLQVQFQVPETSGWKPTIGAPVQLALVGDTNRSVTAHVVKISPTIDAASDSYDVLAQLGGNGIGDLRPGMAVHVSWPAANAAAKKQ